jgi:hypothetical protein
LAVAFARWLDVDFAVWCDDATGRLIVERGLIWCGGEGVARRRESEANLLRL